MKSDLPAPLNESRNHPRIAILMATYQGADYLVAQLDSIAAQTLTDWILWVSDDASSDGTREILKAYQKHWGHRRLVWREGPCSGFASNFLSLLCDSDIHADYYAFADQDDIWRPHKLESALDFLSRGDNSLPALYCSRTLLIDRGGRDKGLSGGLRRPPAFANALVQNIASGNTMVFNRAARQQAASQGAALDIPLHDWWLYMVTSGCGGSVYFSDLPGLLYRQHERNVIGVRGGAGALPGRLRHLFSGDHHRQIVRNLAALSLIKPQLIPEHRQCLEHYLEAQQVTGFKRLARLWGCGVYRQTLPGQLGMLLAAIFNKA